MEQTSSPRRPLSVELELSMALLHIESLKFTRNIILDICAGLRKRVDLLESMVFAEDPRLHLAGDEQRSARKPKRRKRRTPKR